MKIVLYGTCSFPFFYKEVILHSQKEKQSHEWKVLLMSWRHRRLFDGVLPSKDVYYVAPDVNRRMEAPAPPMELLAHYPGSIAKDLAADKNMPGQLKRRLGRYQLRNGLAYYQVYKDYLLKEKPDCVFSPIVESHDGMILYAAARELGIPMVFVTNSRNLRLSFFSSTPNEDIPTDVMRRAPSPAMIEKAEALIRSFQEHPFKAFAFNYDPKPEEIIAFPRMVPPHKKLWRTPQVLLNWYRDATREPHAGRPNPFWYQPREQFVAITRRVVKLKTRWKGRLYDIASVAELPQRFFYLPLHVAPELTITTMAPFFEDQLRAVDLIRFSMPADHVLIVKEHPMMKGRRESAFYQALRHRPGVVLVDHDLPSLELIKRAAVTLAITGTAAFEALLLSRPSVLLAETFFFPWVTRFSGFETFEEVLRKAMTEAPSAIHARAVDCVARVLAAGHDFIIYDPHTPDHDPKWVMNERNIAVFLSGFLDHLSRLTDARPAHALR